MVGAGVTTQKVVGGETVVPVINTPNGPGADVTMLEGPFNQMANQSQQALSMASATQKQMTQLFGMVKDNNAQLAAVNKKLGKGSGSRFEQQRGRFYNNNDEDRFGGGRNQFGGRGGNGGQLQTGRNGNGQFNNGQGGRTGQRQNRWNDLRGSGDANAMLTNDDEPGF